MRLPVTEGKKMPTSTVKEVVRSAKMYGRWLGRDWSGEESELRSSTSPLLRYALHRFSVNGRETE